MKKAAAKVKPIAMKKPAAATQATAPEEEEPDNEEAAVEDDGLGATRDRIKARKFKAVFETLPTFIQDEFRKACFRMQPSS